MVRVDWEPAGSPRLRWPLPSPQGLTGAFFWVGGSPLPRVPASPAKTLGLGTGTVQRIKQETGAA